MSDKDWIEENTIIEIEPLPADSRSMAEGFNRYLRNHLGHFMASKKIIRATQGNTEEELAAIQAEMYIPVFTSNDAKEGPAAFAEKREPNWTGT